MFQNSYSKEHSRTDTYEIPCKSCPFLNKKTGCSSNTLTGRSPANQILHKMLQNFLEHLIVKRSFSRKSFWTISHLFAGVSPSFASSKLYLKKNYFKYMKDRSNSNFIHIYLYFVNSLFIYANNCGYVQVICIAISINEIHWNCEKSSQGTNWAVMQS